MAGTGTGEANYIHLRLFMEGIEVPVIGASVNASVNQPSSASIQIVPSDTLSTLLPRTVVHLFYLDAVEFTGSQLGAPEDQHYKLMFCGEVFDISFAKSGQGSRTVTLRCMDFSNTWDTNYSYVMRYAVGAQEDPSGNAITKDVSGFVGGGASDGLSSPNPFDDIVNDPATVIRQMALASAGNPACPGNGTILGGLLAVLELLSGIQGLYMGINPWATIEERRCRVMDSIVSDNGQTAKSLFDQQVFSDWLQQRVGTVGSVISFRQIIQIICQYIYYDVVTNVTPMYEPGNDGNGRPGRLAPEYVVTGTASSQAQAASVENVRDVIEEMSEYETFSGVSIGKIKNIAAEFWPYVETMLKKMDELAKGKKYLYGAAANDEFITFAMTSGHRNVAANLRLQKASGRTPDPEAAAKGAHAKGYAVDISGRGNQGGGVNLGSMPYRNEPKENCTGAGFSKLTVDIPQENISDSSVSRFRYAIKHIYDRDNVVITDFEALVLKIKADTSLMELCFGSSETLDKHADYLRNMKTFFLEVYKPAVAFANASNNGITGSWGGSWKHRCPLFHCLGMGPDPVHIQDANYTNKPSTTQTAPPPSVVARLSEGEVREQLKSFIFRPNIWFCPPPVCNVLYPHMYESMSVSRQMLRETTRLQLDAFNQFYESVILSTYYYAPKFPEGNHIFGSGMGSVTKTILMDHEVFSGIVPKMERISEISFYAKSSGQGSDLRIDGTSGELDSSAVSDANSSASGASIAEYGDRVAHFNLLTHRYSARSGSASGPFNPYLVCGFPALIVNELVSKSAKDRAASVSTIASGNRDPEIAKKTQWLGMITSIDHTFNQSGARTAIGLSYVRSHRVGDDTDDLLSESVTDQGSFTVQDPNFQPEGVPRVVSHNFASGTVATTAEDHKVATGLSTQASDYAWIIAAITATYGGSSLAEVLLACQQRFAPVDPVTKARIEAAYADPGSYESSTAGTADFSRNGDAVSTLANLEGPNKAPVESIEWSGEPTVILISLTATEPCSIGDLVSWTEEGGKLGLITYDSFLTKSFKLGESAAAVKDSPKLVRFMDVTWPVPVVDPLYISAVIPIKLPGSTLTATLSPPATGAEYDRSLPVEEAIRPPWIDKDTYSSALSTKDTFTKLDLHYRHLFGSPSIIHRLLLNEATPYDGMDVHSVEQAVDFIVADAGSLIDEPDVVLNSYTSALTTRPIASLSDVLAPKGYLPVRDSLGRISWQFDESLTSKQDLQVSGGFHSNAVTGLKFSKDGKSSNADGVSPDSLEFGAALEFLDLVGLTGPDGTPRVLGSRLTEGEAEEISSATAVRADPRAPRAKRVKRYLDDINGSSALRQVPNGVTFIKTPPGVGRKG